MSLAAQKEVFEAKLADMMKPASAGGLGGAGNERSPFMTEAKYNDVLACVQQWDKLTDKKARRERWNQGHCWVKKYDVVTFGDDVQQLIFRGKARGDAQCGLGNAAVAAAGETPGEDAADESIAALDTVVLVSHAGRVFDDLHKIHLEGGHCRAKAFLDRVKARFGASITERIIVTFTECCPQCQRSNPRKAVTAGHKPIITGGARIPCM